MTKKSIGILFGIALYAAVSHGQEQEDLLTLTKAEEMALRYDPVLAQFQEEQKAFDAQAVADGSWPDPVLKFGFAGLPSDSRFDEKDTMEQIVGLSQKLPSWGLVGHKKKALQAQAQAMHLRAEDRALKVVMSVRILWLDLHFYHQSVALIRGSKKVFQQLVKITEFQYRAGRGQQHDVMQARVELGLLDDREAEMQQEIEESLAELNRFVGTEKARHRLDLALPTLPSVGEKDQLEQIISGHPSIRARLADLKAAEEAVKLAESQYVPSISLDLTYGERAGERADLLSAMVELDVPILPHRRQGKDVTASRARAVSVQGALNDQHRENVELFQREFAAWRSLNGRLKHFQQSVMPESAQNAEASLRSYQNGVTEFTVVARARLLELESGLMELRLRVDAAKAQAKILYVSGDKTL